ncbi:MAG: ABC transporter substrate-binding protein [Rhodobacteraceae bacterium]|nr:ABC transporter substrate-binding protein [Paracoccaceae bacterium]
MNRRHSILDAINRRRFLEATFAAGVSAAAGATLLGATRARAQAARKGGDLRLAFPNAIDSLDPHKAGSVAGQTLSGALFDNLTAFGPDNVSVVPRLAVSWRPEAGGQEWVLDLRQGVKFHDGSDFTSADVVATIAKSLDKARAGYASGIFGPVVEARPEGTHTVRVVLSQPFADFPVSCAGRWSRIMPATGIDAQAETPNGTGPFKLGSHEQGTSTRIVRNEAYWDGERPHLDSISFFQIAESVSQQAAIRGGAVDVINQIGSETYLALQNIPGVVPYSQPSGRYQVGYTLAHLDPFKDWRVRLAFKHLIDRKALLASALLGQGVVGNDVQLPPGHPLLVDLPVHDQDFAKARSLLAEAGVGSLALDIWTTSERPPSPKMALAIKEGAAAVGIDITVRDIPFTEYRANVPRKMPLFTSQWSDTPTLFELFYLVHHTKGAANYSTVEIAPGTDARIEAIIAEIDAARRKQLVGELLPIIQERSDRIIPYFQNFFAVSTDRVKGFNPIELFDVRDIWMEA